MSERKYFELAKSKLFPINRSLTGRGVRKTLKIIKNEFPSLNIKKIRSGKKVFDWKIPAEWNIHNAYILDKKKNKIIDYKKNNLHIVGYSKPINKYLKKRELLKKLYSLKNQKNAIPYITSYYKKDWGFCIKHAQKKKIEKFYKSQDLFKVLINTNFNKNGYLNYGELVIKGKSKNEILITTYICHPSMANNELSGPIVSMSLINFFKKKKMNNTLRFIFVPETIGSIAYLHKNLKKLKKNVIGGYLLTCVGDNKNHSCKLSKFENSPCDNALLEAYKKNKIKFKKYSFTDGRSDERQYNSPGINIPLTSIFRTKYGEFSEYHTSLDNFNLVSLKGIKGSIKISKSAILILDKKIFPKYKLLCEPHMVKRKIFPTLSNKNSKTKLMRNYLNFLQFSDGNHSLQQISKILNISLIKTTQIFKFLKKKKLV